MAVYDAYNHITWPLPAGAYGLGWAVFALAVWRKPISDRFIAAYLCLLWLWLGFVFHMLFTSVLSFASYILGVFFLYQGTLFFRRRFRPTLVFSRLPSDLYHMTGAAIALYSLMVYPILGLAFGEGIPRTPAAGFSPGAGVAFTLGLLLMTSKPCPAKLIWIPFFASLVGSSLAFLFDINEDKPLVFIAFIAAWLITRRGRPAVAEPPRQAVLYG